MSERTAGRVPTARLDPVARNERVLAEERAGREDRLRARLRRLDELTYRRVQSSR